MVIEHFPAYIWYLFYTARFWEFSRSNFSQGCPIPQWPIHFVVYNGGKLCCCNQENILFIHSLRTVSSFVHFFCAATLPQLMLIRLPPYIMGVTAGPICAALIRLSRSPNLCYKPTSFSHRGFTQICCPAPLRISMFLFLCLQNIGTSQGGCTFSMPFWHYTWLLHTAYLPGIFTGTCTWGILLILRPRFCSGQHQF